MKKLKLWSGVLIGFFLMAQSFSAQTRNQIFAPKSTSITKIHVRADKFSLEKHPPLKFVPLDRTFFKIPATKTSVTLKNGLSLPVEEYLKEVNALEQELNKFGYSLRDSAPIKIQYLYPREQFPLQKKILSSYWLKNTGLIRPSQITCEGFSEGKTEESGQPTDPVPLDWEKNWQVSFGNNDFGADLAASIKLSGDKNSLAAAPLFASSISIFGRQVDVLKIEKIGERLNGKLLNQEFINLPLNQAFHRPFGHESPWIADIRFEVPILHLIEGQIKFEGKTNTEVELSPSPDLIFTRISPYIELNFSGKLSVDCKIASAELQGHLTPIVDQAVIEGKVERLKAPNQFSKKYEYYRIYTSGKNKLITLLKGDLIIKAEVDLIFYSKKFEIDLFKFNGFQEEPPEYMTLFSYNTSIPVEKDHKIWLVINQIRGITPYTARNEKLSLEPKEFEISLNLGSKNLVKTIKDVNGDGYYGPAEKGWRPVTEPPLMFEIPLLSFRKVPISIEISEKYNIGTLEFKSPLDLASGTWNNVDLCYDPGTRRFTGTKNGGENEDLISTGDTNYWGERNHGISFKLTPTPLKAAPAKAK